KLGAGGVVRDAHLRKEAVAGVAASALSLGLGCNGVVASSLPGPAGNVEYFLWLQKGAPELIEVDLDHAIQTGPA
ncbi:MAG: 16S/23S rRNA (cytidine-2'-O)-methyltransferase, partial [Actinobacteria bacterium]|nr:16S/23S rRNA (cytidine-2'-O)-methyltransferase [Actinomycetota bacterium]